MEKIIRFSDASGQFYVQLPQEIPRDTTFKSGKLGSMLFFHGSTNPMRFYFIITSSKTGELLGYFMPDYGYVELKFVKEIRESLHIKEFKNKNGWFYVRHRQPAPQNSNIGYAGETKIYFYDDDMPHTRVESVVTSSDTGELLGYMTTHGFVELQFVKRCEAL